MSNLQSRHKWEPYLWLIPSIVLLAVFLIYPIIIVFKLSFSEISKAGIAGNFVGLKNFRDAIGLPAFRTVMLNTLWWVLAVVGLSTISGFILALILNQEFFGGDPNKPEFKARIIHGEYKGGIIEEYMGFCRIWDENVLKAKTPEEKQQAVTATIDLCIHKGYLVRYLEEHRPEVEKIMMTMFSPEYVKMVSERTERIKGDISAYRFINMPEAQIKDAIIRRYDLTPTYAQNFLDDDSDPEDSRPWAL